MSAAEADVAGLPTDPGSRLRRQREQAGFTEQQVADQLNLDSGIVGALERNDYATEVEKEIGELFLGIAWLFNSVFAMPGA